MPYPYEDDPNAWLQRLPGYQYLYGEETPGGQTYDPGVGPGLVRAKPEDEGIGYYAAKLGGSLLSGAGSAIGAALYPLSLPKRGLDYLARQVARAEGLNPSEDMTMGQMLGEAAFPGPPEGEGIGAHLQAAAKGALEFGADVGLDPVTYLPIGFAGGTKGARIAAEIMAKQPGLQLYAPKAAQALSSAVESPISQFAARMAERFAPAGADAAQIAAQAERYQKPLQALGTAAHYGVVGQMAAGGVSGIARAAAQAATQGWTPEATYEAVKGAGELGMAGLGQYSHLAGEQARARAVAGQQRFAPTRVLPIDSLPDAVQKEGEAWSRQWADQMLGGVEPDRSELPDHLQPHGDIIMQQAREDLSGLKGGRDFVDRLRQEHQPGAEGIAVEPGPNDSQRVIQRDKDGQIIGGAQVDAGNNLQFVAGGRAMGSPVSAGPIYDKLQEMGAQKLDMVDAEGKPTTLSSLGAMARRAVAEQSFPAPLLEGRESMTSLTRQQEEAKQQLSQAGLGDLLAQPAYAVEKTAPPFYSQLQNVVVDPKTQARQSGEQWLRFLSDPNRGVKADELKWTGLDDFLAERKGQPVTKQEIQQHLAENAVQVQEVTKGAPGVGEAAEPTKFSAHTTPGGDNYRELLLTLPEKRAQTYREAQAAYIKARDAGADQVELQRLANDVAAASDPTTGLGRPDTAFRAGHFDEPNVLAHIRFNDRVDSEGKRVLFVEEVQSDWAQKGRKEGFRDDPQRIADLQNQYRQITDVLAKTKDPQEQIRLSSDLVNIEAAIHEAKSLGHPKAPFVTDTSKWTELAMKRVLKYAADNGYDKVAWTTGEQQAARYDLSKQIQEISWRRVAPKSGVREARYNLNIWPKGENSFDVKGLDPKALVDHVGKELADKIVASTEERGDFTGLDLKVGGEGMKGFYDQILPQTVNKLGKKFGAKVGKTEIDLTHGARMYPEQAAKAKAAGDTATVHSLDIPQSMRETVKREGFPLFAVGEKGQKKAPSADLQRLLVQLYPEGSHIKEEKGRFTITLPNKRQVVWRPDSDGIEIDASAFEKGYGRKPEPGEQAVGATWRLPNAAVVDIVQSADARAALHEHWHVLKHLGVLNDKQQETLSKRFKNEEEEADAFADWWKREQRPADSIWQKIGKGISNLYELITGQPEAVFRKAAKEALAGQQAGLPPTLLRRVGERLSGAPPAVKNEQDIHALADKLTGMAKAGEANRYWYEDAAKRVKQLTQGNPKDEEKFLRLLAIYSPNNPVSGNWVDALQAWDVYKSLGKEAGLKRLNAGEKVIQAGRFGHLDRKAEDALFRDKEWKGLKTNSFYGNLAALLFPNREQSATIDVHMLRAYGYPRDTAGEAQYQWANALTKHVAEQLGWTPWQTQAAIWSVVRGAGKGAATFPEASRENVGAIGMEAVPHPDSGHPLAALASQPYDVRQRYTRDAMKAIVDPKTGVDELAQAHGLMRDDTIEGPGYYEGEYNPGFHVLTQLVQRQGYEKGTPASAESISPGGLENVRNYARDLASLYNQKAAGIIRPFPSGTKATETGRLVELGQTPTQEQLAAFIAAFPSDIRDKVIFDYSPEGILVHRNSNDVTPQALRQAVIDAGARVDTKLLGSNNLVSRPFQSVTEEVKNAELQGGGRAAAPARSPAVQGAYDRVLSRLEAVNRGWESGQPEAPEAFGEAPRESAGVALSSEQRGPPVAYAVAPGAVPPVASQASGTRGPRVEQRVQSLDEAITEQRRLGIPAADLNLAREQRRTWASIDPEVQKKIKTWDDDEILKKVTGKRSLDDVEVQALDAVVRGRREAKELARLDYLDKKGGPDEAQAWRKYVETLANFVPLERANVNDGTGTARALAARGRIMQAAQTKDAKFLRQVLREIPGIDERGAEELQAMFETGDPRLSDALRAAFASRWKQWQTILRAFLITPSSEMANGIGNSIGLGAEIADQAASSGVDWLVSSLRGTQRERHLGAVGAGLGAMIEEVPNAVNNFLNERFVQIYKRAWTGEGRPIEVGRRLEYQMGAPFAGTGVLARLGRLTATSLDAMQAGDELFQSPVAMQEMGSRAYELAKQKLGPAAPETRVRAEALNIVADATHFPEKYPKLINDIRSSTQRRLFKDKPWHMVQVLQNLSERYPWMSAVLPFIKTPGNIARYAIHHSPMGMLTPEFGEAVKRLASGKGEISQGEAADVVARRLVGTAIFAMAAGAAKLGKITNGGPGDPNDKKALMETGWRPYSIVVNTPAGKAYIPFARFDPISQVMGIAADVAGLVDARDEHDAATRAIGSIAENFTSRTYLQGLIDFSEALSDPLRFAGNYAISIGEMHIPRQVARIAQALDPVVRDVKPTVGGVGGFLQQALNSIKRDIPGVSQTMPAKYGPTGEPVVRPGDGVLGFAMRAVSPIQVSPEKENRQLEAIMAQIGYSPSDARRYMTIKGHQVVLDQRQVDTMHKADAAAAYELRMLVSNPMFAAMPDTIEEGGDRSKEAIIRKVYNKHRDYARQAIMQQPDFIASARQQLADWQRDHPQAGGVL